MRRLNVEVREIDDDGQAVARAIPGAGAGKGTRDDRPVIIAAGAVPGDRLQVAVERESRGARFARVLRVLAPSPDRVPARCPAFGSCGGCAWQAIAYPVQLRLKRRRLVRAVRRTASLRDVPVGEVRAAAVPYGFRTKIQMPVGGRRGALAIGFFRPGTHEIMDVPECAAHHPEGNRIVAEARRILDRSGVEPYDERRHGGTLRTLLVRVDPASGRAAMTLVARTARFPERRKVAERLAAIRGLQGLHLNVQPARGNVVLGRRTERLAGRERLLVGAGGKRFLLSPTAFFQTSGPGAEALVERARAWLDGPWGTLVDLYCGVGLFARCLADRARRVTGVEENRAAVEDAEAGLALDGEEANVSFVAAPAEAWARAAEPADALVLDPPRAGCDERLLDAVARRIRPRRIAYVSCFPETLLRDLDRLARLGYRTARIDPVDMFPHTPHLECVAGLERESAY